MSADGDIVRAALPLHGEPRAALARLEASHEQTLAHDRHARTMERRAKAAEAQLAAATTMLAEAEKIVPGIITTAGRFSIGLNDRERADAAEAQRDALAEALGEVDYIASQAKIGGPTMDGKQAYSSPRFGQIREIARAALTKAGLE